VSNIRGGPNVGNIGKPDQRMLSQNINQYVSPGMPKQPLTLDTSGRDGKGVGK
jgi:hypothetical protein